MTTPTITSVELLALGESQTLEFKKTISLMKEAFMDLTAMVNANAAKGMVVFGVGPTGTVLGLGDTNLDSAQSTLANHAQQKVDPPLMLEIQPFLCDGQPILILSADRLRSTPFHEYDGRAYIRVGSVSQQMSVSQKSQLSLSRDRDRHSGPWICDECGLYVSHVGFDTQQTPQGVKRIYAHVGCTGEFWPAS